jgi:hypothetical protein
VSTNQEVTRGKEIVTTVGQIEDLVLKFVVGLLERIESLFFRRIQLRGIFVAGRLKALVLEISLRSLLLSNYS